MRLRSTGVGADAKPYSPAATVKTHLLLKMTSLFSPGFERLPMGISDDPCLPPSPKQLLNRVKFLNHQYCQEGVVAATTLGCLKCSLRHLTQLNGSADETTI